MEEEAQTLTVNQDAGVIAVGTEEHRVLIFVVASLVCRET